MDAKRHFWVDYLACLIFGAVIVPLYRFWRGYLYFDAVDVFMSVAILAGVHVVCFMGLRLFLKEKKKRVSFLYCVWGIFWFTIPVMGKFVPLLGLFYDYRWFLVAFFSVVVGSGILVLMRNRRLFFCESRVIGMWVYMLFVLLLLQLCRRAFFCCDRDETIATDRCGGSNSRYPNIYHILLDAHPNQKGLELFGGDLKPFYGKLEKLGFITYPRSKSSYSLTSVSVPAMWFMDAEVHKCVNCDSGVARTMVERGYALRVYLSSNVLNPVYHSGLKYRGVKFNCLLDTFVQLCAKTVCVMLLDRWTVGFHKRCHRFVLSALEYGCREYGFFGNFFYGHILSPHPPLVYSDEKNLSYTTDLDAWSRNISVSEYAKPVCENVYRIDNLVLKTVETILDQYKNNIAKPIIVLHSDHGIVRGCCNIGIYPNATEDTVYGNLFAIYMPDEWKEDAKGLKFINLYRFIFNHLFGTNYEYLPDVRKNEDGSIFKKKTLPPSEQ